MSKLNISLKLLAAMLASAVASHASINIETVYVGDAGNLADSTGYGAVSYDYHVGTYEVTNAQYVSFLNAKAKSDPNNLHKSDWAANSNYGIERLGSDGNYSYQPKTGMANKPVAFVTFWDAARFSNWLTNGQGAGDTESGIYSLTTLGIADNTVTRNQAAWNAGGVAIANEDEWYKAAYYDQSLNSGAGDYWLYATQQASGELTTADANYGKPSGGVVTEVGSFAGKDSYYGTYDQVGNVYEWNESIMGSTQRLLRGGSWSAALASTGRNPGGVTGESGEVGFRVASLELIPEPSKYALLLGIASLAIVARRRL